MDDVVNDLLQELKALHTDLGTMRSEARAQHVEKRERSKRL
jgi:hypothetical protein